MFPYEYKFLKIQLEEDIYFCGFRSLCSPRLHKIS